MNAVVVCRSIAAVLLGVMVVMPSFWLAGVLYGARMIFNTLSIPVRQSFLMGVIPPAERSRRGRDGELSRAGRLVDQPIHGGVPDAAGVVGVALEIAALLQALNAILYYFFFRAVRPPEEISAGTGERL